MAGLRYEDTRPGAWDPVERLKDQDLDGIRAEIMYPGVFGLWCYNASDDDLHVEIVRVYNDWIAEFSASSPDRLMGVGILPMRGSTESKIAEVERCARLGLRSVMLAPWKWRAATSTWRVATGSGPRFRMSGCLWGFMSAPARSR